MIQSGEIPPPIVNSPEDGSLAMPLPPTSAPPVIPISYRPARRYKQPKIKTKKLRLDDDDDGDEKGR